MELSVKLANGYFSMLKSLSRETKLRLIRLLTDSMLKEENKELEAREEKLERLFGCWADDPEAPELINKERSLYDN